MYITLDDKKLENEENLVSHARKIEKSIEIIENDKFDCGKKNYYFQNLCNIQSYTPFPSH